MKKASSRIGYVAILLLGAGLSLCVYIKSSSDMRHSESSYKKIASTETAMAAKSISRSLNEIYQGIRTISFLPSVKSIDRYGKNLDANARESIIQIYNNIANSISISEIYIVPVDLDPEKIDAETKSLEIPILMFDDKATAEVKSDEKSDEPHITSIAQAEAASEVEIYEYRLLKEQLAYLKANYGDQSKINKLDVPLVGGREVLTCDNGDYSKTKNDQDRKGVVLSVPFYDNTGKLKGLLRPLFATMF
jgi:hypothetical protein